MAQAVNAGRGVLYLALAKAYFMVAGYAIYFTLPRLFASDAQWGNYLLVVGLVSVIDNVIVTGTIQGVSRFTAQGDFDADAVKRTALRVQLAFGGAVAGVYLALAPWIAAMQRDPELTDLYRTSAGIVICYAIYAVFVGSVNGLRHFGKQASLDCGFATLRATLIIGAAGAGLGVAGSLGGFVSAAAIIVVVSAIWVGLPRTQERFPPLRLLSFVAQLFLYTFTLNGIMRADLILLKRFATALVPEGDPAAAAEAASTVAAYYGSAQSLAFIPYQAILAVAFVIFPLISRSTFENDIEKTRGYIRQTLRLSLIFTAGVAVVFIANPEQVIVVPYPDRYHVGGPALRILAGGMICFSMFTIVNTILNGAGHTADTISAGLVTLAVTVASNILAVPRAGSPEAALQVAAWATSGSIAVGLVLSTVLLVRRYAAAFPPWSLARIAVAMAAALAVGHYVPAVSKLVTLAECALVFAVYLAVLLLLREFDREDLRRFGSVFRR